MTVSFVVPAFLMISCTTRPANVNGSSVFCPTHSGETISVSSRGVARLPVDSPVRALRALCPAARDTFVSGEVGSSPALRFSFRGATVIGVQFDTFATPEPSYPLDLWIIRGDSVILPQGLTLRSDWATIRRAYGNAGGQIQSIDTVDFAFCTLPRLLFRISAEGVDSMAPLTDPASFPDSTHLVAVLIKREGMLVPSTC